MHSTYLRRLDDLPWQGRPVEVRVRVRRFRCANVACRRRIFAERLSSVAAPRTRGTRRLRDAQRRIGLALGGEPGARLACALAMPVSGDTLLRLICSAGTPVPPAPLVRVLGIDDWAWRRGHRYGTILCDLERGRVVDLLPDREAESVAAWLKAHPGVEIVARDRAGAYADGIRSGAPAAVQVADRWHLLRNLGDAVRGVFDQHHREVRRAARDAAERLAPTSPPVQARPPTRAEQRSLDKLAARQARYEEAARLHAAGLPIRRIASLLGHERKTIRHWLRAGCAPSWRKPPRPRLLDPYRPYLEQRWREGVRNAALLWRELRDQGFRGGSSMIRHWASRRRDAEPGAAALAPSAPARPAGKTPSSRRAARLMTADTATLTDAEQRFVSTLAAQSPDIAGAADLARRFAALVRDRRGSDDLKAGLAQAERSPLRAFAKGLRQDLPAVHAALSLPWSTSPVEGQINRLKMLKRQMYGRAGFGLLQRRLLAA